ncbi:MAG TPA: hypothetical protein VMI54_30465, partial [Polyangiaceae bacterium]|nr:hypothetical protein [Polyangiaceae bacterium]
MSEFERFLASGAEPHARALLRAGLADAPSAEAMPRVAAALGLATAMVGVVPVAAAAGGAVAVNGAASGGAVAAKLPLASATSALALSKWLIAGAVSGAVVASTAAVVERVHAPAVNAAAASGSASPAAATRPEVARRAPLALNPSPDVPGASATVAATEPPISREPGVPDKRVAGAPSTPGSRTSASDSDTLGAEAARIDAARRALSSGDLERALAELDEYQRLRAVGVLDREALLLRIQVLVRRG